MTEKEITHYEVISDIDPNHFKAEVNRLLTDGWSVYGNVAHGYIEDSEGRAIVSRQVLVKWENR